MYPARTLLCLTFHVFSTSMAGSPGAPVARLGPAMACSCPPLLRHLPPLVIQNDFYFPQVARSYKPPVPLHMLFTHYCHQCHRSLVSAWQILVLWTQFRCRLPFDTFTDFSQIKLIISTSHLLGLNFHCFGLLKLFLFTCPSIA